MNKLKIGWLLAFLGLGMLISITGCSKSDYGLSPEDPVIISFWHYYSGAQQQILDEKVIEFNSTIGKEKGIIIEAFSQGNVKELTYKISESMNQTVGSEEIPDMFSAYADTAFTIDKERGIVDISKYLSDKEIDEYISAYIEEGMFGKNGGIKIFPIAKSTEVLMINKTDWDLFSKATGASEELFTSWEGLAQTAEAYYKWTDSLTEEPNDGKAFCGRDSMANYILVGSMQLGHEIFQVENNKVTLDFDRDAMRRIWDNYYVPYINGYYTSKLLFRSDDIKTGDLIAKIGSISGTTYFPTSVVLEDGSNYDIDMKAFILPNFYGTVPHAVQQGAGIVVMKSEPRKEYGAILFLKWFTEIENNIEFSMGSGYLPVLKKANIKYEIREAIEKKETVSSTLEEVLYLGIQTVREYKMYANKAFENSDLAREILDVSMENRAKEDYEKIQELISSGMSREEAVSRFDTDDNYNQWYEQTKEELLAVLP